MHVTYKQTNTCILGVHFWKIFTTNNRHCLVLFVLIKFNFFWPCPWSESQLEIQPEPLQYCSGHTGSLICCAKREFLKWLFLTAFLRYNGYTKRLIFNTHNVMNLNRCIYSGEKTFRVIDTSVMSQSFLGSSLCVCVCLFLFCVVVRKLYMSSTLLTDFYFFNIY